MVMSDVQGQAFTQLQIVMHARPNKVIRCGELHFSQATAVEWCWTNVRHQIGTGRKMHVIARGLRIKEPVKLVWVR